MRSYYFSLHMNARKRPTHHLGCSSVNNKYVILRVLVLVPVTAQIISRIYNADMCVSVCIPVYTGLILGRVIVYMFVYVVPCVRA